MACLEERRSPRLLTKPLRSRHLHDCQQRLLQPELPRYLEEARNMGWQPTAMRLEDSWSLCRWGRDWSSVSRSPWSFLKSQGVSTAKSLCTCLWDILHTAADLPCQEIDTRRLTRPGGQRHVGDFAQGHQDGASRTALSLTLSPQPDSAADDHHQMRECLRVTRSTACSESGMQGRPWSLSHLPPHLHRGRNGLGQGTAGWWP